MPKTIHKGQGGEQYKLTDSLSFQVFGTGSKGNSGLLIDEKSKFRLLIDCGLTFNKIKADFMKHRVKYVFVTHSHGDHAVPTCFNQILKLNKYVQFYMSKETYEVLLTKKSFKGIPEENLNLVTHGDIVSIDSFTLHFRNGRHGVPCLGVIIEDGESKGMYATDMRDFSYFETINGEIQTYDYMLKELNYNEDILRSRMAFLENKITSAKLGQNTGKERAQVQRLLGSSWHCSKNISTKFGVLHGGPNVTIVNLHGSSDVL